MGIFGGFLGYFPTVLGHFEGVCADGDIGFHNLHYAKFSGDHDLIFKLIVH